MMHMLRHPLTFLRDHRFTTSHASDYLDDDLDRAQACRVSVHTSICPRCRRLVETLRATITELGLLRDRPGGETVADHVIARLRSES